MSMCQQILAVVSFRKPVTSLWKPDVRYSCAGETESVCAQALILDVRWSYENSDFHDERLLFLIHSQNLLALYTYVYQGKM